MFVLVGTLVVALVVVALVWVARGRTEHAQLGRPERDVRADPAIAVTRWCEEAVRALRSGDRADLERLAAPEDAAALASIAANVHRLGVRGLALRYVDDSDVELTARQRSLLGQDVWVSDLELRWRLAGYDRKPSSVEVPVVFQWRPDGTAVFVTSRVTGGYRVPSWLLGEVAVRRTPRTLVIAPGPQRARQVSRQAATAVRTVHSTVTGWDGPLVVEATASGQRFQSSAGMSAADAKSIAAVTTTTDGTNLPSSPVHVYLNPRVYDPLGPRGQQIVLSHEAAHVALGAATSAVPMWLSEGIADYIALVDSALPVTVLAAQIIARVRKQGAPDHLPGQAEFGGANPDIGAHYESAWLAARLIAQQYGEPALLRFYAVARRNGNDTRAFRTVLETTQQRFEEDWQRELQGLAG